MGGIVRNLKATALNINGPMDHVHLLVVLPPTLCMSDFLRDLKSNSTGWVREQGPKRFAFGWQIGYGAFSVSESNVEEVKAYIANQEEHHRIMSFQEEFVSLLKKHGIQYDEKYIWE